MFIPDDKIEEVRAASDIVDVVSDYVRLKKQGSRFVGLCPFHSEKSPSFSVDPRQNLFYCFGCKKGGDVFSFVRELEGLEFNEAVRMLADRFGVALPTEDAVATEAASEAESIYNALRFAARYFYGQLAHPEVGRRARTYLLDRGLTPETIKRFGIGYAPEAWDGLLKAAAEHHIGPQMLEKAGLVVEKDGGHYYDRYRGRVIFPIFSHVGKVIGFGGRILEKVPDQPKYINSPETKVYHKGRVLYGLYQGKQAIRRAEEVILVEGYMDVVSLHQAGVENVVAASGTALTAEQVKILGRYAKRVLLLYDADAAGNTAAMKTIDLVLENELAVYAVSLPGGEDPDSYVREHGGEAFLAYAQKHRRDFVEFKYERLRQEGLMDTPEGQAAAARSILESVACIPDKLVRDAYVRRAAEVLREPDVTLFRIVDQLRARRSGGGPEHRRERVPEPAPVEVMDAPAGASGRERSLPAPSTRAPSAEEMTMIRLMLLHGAPMIEFLLTRMALEEFSEGVCREIVTHLLAQFEQGTVDARPFLDGDFGEETRDLAASLLIARYEVSTNWAWKNIPVPVLDEDPYKIAEAAFRNHRKALTARSIRQVWEQQRFVPADDVEEQRRLQSRLMELYRYMKELDPEGSTLKELMRTERLMHG